MSIRPVSRLVLAIPLSACPSPPESNSRLQDLEGDFGVLEELYDELRVEHEALRAAHDQLASAAVTVLRGDVTLEVPGSFPDIQAALASLDAVSLGAGATVSIRVADGVYSHSDPIVVDHSDGDKIRIVGNVDEPAAVVLGFSGVGSGIVVDRGHVLGWLDGVTIQGDHSGTGAGLDVAKRAVLITGSSVVVQDFHNGIRAAEGSLVVMSDGVESHGNTANGWLGTTGSVIVADGAIATGNGGAAVGASGGSFIRADSVQAIENDSFGFFAWGGSSIIASDAVSDSNHAAGFRAEDGSVVVADGATATNTVGGGGFVAEAGSVVVARGGFATSNDESGLAALSGSIVDADKSTLTGNGFYGVTVGEHGVVDADEATVSGNDDGDFSRTPDAMDGSGNLILW